MKKYAVVLLLLSQFVRADQISDLSGVTDQITGDSHGVSVLASKYKMTNAGTCPLLIIGASSTNSVPLYFIPGSMPVSGLQADITVAPGITVTGITIGPEATAAGKSISSISIPGGERFLLVGFNQTALSAGTMAFVNLDMTTASIGPHLLALVNFSATSPDGNTIPLCATTGVITK